MCRRAAGRPRCGQRPTASPAPRPAGLPGSSCRGFGHWAVAPGRCSDRRTRRRRSRRRAPDDRWWSRRANDRAIAIGESGDDRHGERQRRRVGRRRVDVGRAGCTGSAHLRRWWWCTPAVRARRRTRSARGCRRRRSWQSPAPNRCSCSSRGPGSCDRSRVRVPARREGWRRRRRSRRRRSTTRRAVARRRLVRLGQTRGVARAVAVGETVVADGERRLGRDR